MGADQTVRQQVQTQVDVIGVHGRLGQILDCRFHGHTRHTARLVGADEVLEAGVGLCQPTRPGFLNRLIY